MNPIGSLALAMTLAPATAIVLMLRSGGLGRRR